LTEEKTGEVISLVIANKTIEVAAPSQEQGNLTDEQCQRFNPATGYSSQGYRVIEKVKRVYRSPVKKPV
jgi:hypothetical protein